MSSGGLVSALSATRDSLAFAWVGWLGIETPLAEQAALRSRLWRDHQCVPVFLPAALVESYYNGFANDILWPALHFEEGNLAEGYSRALCAAYDEANDIFAAAVTAFARSSEAAPGALIWVHDYHLLLLPGKLKALLPSATLGFFLHTPFPSFEASGSATRT